MKIMKEEQYEDLVSLYKQLYRAVKVQPYVLEAANGNKGYWIYTEAMDEMMYDLRKILNEFGYQDNPHGKRKY